jgi:rare lipoprotein A
VNRVILILPLLLMGCAGQPEQPATLASDPVVAPPPTPPAEIASGCSGKRIVASYYWEGHHTASGERFDPNGLTAAHRTLPFGTQLTVTNPKTGTSVVVVINDRGPFVPGVSLDLSLGAAKVLGMRGTGPVCLIDPPYPEQIEVQKVARNPA